MRIVALDRGVDQRPFELALGRRQLPPVGAHAGGVDLDQGARQGVGGEPGLARRDHFHQQLAVGADAGELQSLQLRELRLAQLGRIVRVVADQALGDMLGRPGAQRQRQVGADLEGQRPRARAARPAGRSRRRCR